jgi:hypothetical protein
MKLINKKISKTFKNQFKILFLFVFLISLIFHLSSFISGARAQEAASPSATATESSKITYELPYPGLLPDHKLYFIKAARDKIVSFFISDPIKKAEYDLLQADKRIAASQMLVQKGKIDLAQSTFSKAENYFELALAQVDLANRQGTHIGVMAKRLLEANLKHTQVLEAIQSGLSEENKAKFVVERERLFGFAKKAKALQTAK